MWLWYVSKSSGGRVSSIAATAHQHRIGTVMVKSGDGTGVWSQFNAGLVNSLHAQHLDVCAWQFVYGTHPVLEAKVGAYAVKAGADCLLIDAESQYEGRYVPAQRYMRELRHLIGARFPVGLASFPYVDYHPSFPYSVFMGPGGAQYNVPQMYWADIGTTVDEVYSHTYDYNSPYERPIMPLGEVSGSAPPAQLKRFRQLAHVYGAPAVSWWDWQDASLRDWRAVGATVTSLKMTPDVQMPTLQRRGRGVHGRGDLVVWAQEHLHSAGYHPSIDGIFGPRTQSAVRSFQTAHGLQITGRVDAPTWQALLRYPAAKVTWTSRGAHAASARGLTLATPRSASLPALRYEIPADLGSG